MIKVIILTITIINFSHSQQINTCHYTCSTCTTSDYYRCTLCNQNRGGQNLQPISGMCYCINQTDQDEDGVCTGSNEFNYNNKAIIASFIGLSLFFALLIAIITGSRYYLIKTMEDVQQISLLVFLNMYFPQQFDIFLTHLYRFNISSYTFQSLANGSLFQIQTNQQILSTDGQNIFGKYKILYKTANFFSNQFTWILVFVALLIFAIIVRVIRNKLKSMEEEDEKRIKSQSEQTIKNANSPRPQVENESQVVSQKKQENELSPKKYEPSLKYRIINKLFNIIWLNFFIVFFYLSLIEININIFTQIANLTFSSSFAAAGAFFSALFMALQFVLLMLLFFKIQEQTIKPEWMRDYTYCAPIYMIRTNYKTITKYFWFFSCLKKILIALMITVLYETSNYAIIGVSSVTAIFICIAVYSQPFQRRYLRIHFYFTEGFKLFTFLSLINFSEKYVEYIRMIEMTKLLYILMAFIFGFNLFFMVLNVIVERDIYLRYLSKMFCKDSEDNQYLKGKRGYHSQGKLYIYQRE